MTIELFKVIFQNNKKQVCFKRKESKGKVQRAQDEEETEQGKTNYKKKTKEEKEEVEDQKMFHSPENGFLCPWLCTRVSVS